MSLDILITQAIEFFLNNFYMRGKQDQLEINNKKKKKITIYSFKPTGQNV